MQCYFQYVWLCGEQICASNVIGVWAVAESNLKKKSESELKFSRGRSRNRKFRNSFDWSIANLMKFCIMSMKTQKFEFSNVVFAFHKNIR